MACIGGTSLLAGPPGGHAVTMTAEGISGQPLELQEPGAVVADREGKLEVLFIMEPSMRMEAYRNVDLQSGDVIVMANGKRAENLETLQQQLNAVAVGSEIKLGIRRGDEMRVVSYVKADSEALPKRRMMTMKVDAGEGSPVQTSMHTEGGAEEEVVMLQGTGLIARAGDQGPVIGYILDHAREAIKDADVREGDRIVSLQGEHVKDLQSLSAIWNEIAVGDAVDLVFDRDGKSLSAHFIRPPFDPQGGMMMIEKPDTE
jgi:S1-C subfamily serine protease